VVFIFNRIRPQPGTNARLLGMEKHIHPGKVVSSFSVGSRELYDFMNNNPALAMLDVSFVNVSSDV
jgi:acyl-CoA hydrolase